MGQITSADIVMFFKELLKAEDDKNIKALLEYMEQKNLKQEIKYLKQESLKQKRNRYFCYY